MQAQILITVRCAFLRRLIKATHGAKGSGRIGSSTLFRISTLDVCVLSTSIHYLHTSEYSQLLEKRYFLSCLCVQVYVFRVRIGSQKARFQPYSLSHVCPTLNHVLNIWLNVPSSCKYRSVKRYCTLLSFSLFFEIKSTRLLCE